MLVIGKGGRSIKLDSMLTEYTSDVLREVDQEEEIEDIYLDEFSDEIDQWVIEAIKNLGLQTAKEVLNAPREMLIEKADLEEDTVDEVLRILKAEFEEEPETDEAAPEAPEANEDAPEQEQTAEAPAADNAEADAEPEAPAADNAEAPADNAQP